MTQPEIKKEPDKSFAFSSDTHPRINLPKPITWLLRISAFLLGLIAGGLVFWLHNHFSDHFCTKYPMTCVSHELGAFIRKCLSFVAFVASYRFTIWWKQK